MSTIDGDQINPCAFIDGAPAGGGGGGGIPEAPIDGSTYGRRNAAWAVVGGGGSYTPPSYQNTIWADPDGDAGKAGDNPAEPTTFANAMATATFSTCIVLTEGIYTTGGTIAIPASNITIQGVQGGTGSNSIVISDDITIGAGIARFRAHGVRFDGDITDNSTSGSHYFDHCSWGSGTAITRNAAGLGAMTIADSDAESCSYSAAGSGGSLSVTGGDTQFGSISCTATAHAMSVTGIARCGQITGTAGSIVLTTANVIHPTRPIDAAGMTVISRACTFSSIAGTPQPVTCGTHAFAGVIFEPVGSVLGAELGNVVDFTGGIRNRSGVAGVTVDDALDTLASGGSGQPQVVTPAVSSSATATDPEFSGITYTATSATAGMRWMVVDDDGTGVTIDYLTGVMSGGAGASAGNYDIVIRGANTFGVSAEFTITWTVSVVVSLLSEDWESGIGTWTLANDGTNDWGVGTATAQTGTQSAYISDDGGSTNQYNASTAQVSHLWKEFTTPADISGGVELNFAWKAQGEGSASDWDNLKVFVAPTIVTPAAGSEVVGLYNVQGFSSPNWYNLGGASTWNDVTVDITSLVSASTTYRLIFSWKNDGSGGSQPPVAIDNITVIG